MTAGERAAPDELAADFDPFAGAALARVVPTTEPQREIWLAAKLEPAASLAYNEAVAIRLAGALDVDRLRVALGRLVERHEALRSTVTPDGADLCIAEAASIECPLRDLSDLDEALRAEAIAETERHAVETPFDLEQGPLIRAELLRLAGDEHLLVIAAHHLQPYGIVHGGVHTGIIEAACSTGAAIVAIARGQSVVGLENATSFITAVRSGTLRVTATPVTRGRRTQVWQATVTNDEGRTCATGRVRLLCLDQGSELAGKNV